MTEFHYSKGGRRIYVEERVDPGAIVHLTRPTLTYLRRLYKVEIERMAGMGQLFHAGCGKPLQR